MVVLLKKNFLYKSKLVEEVSVCSKNKKKIFSIFNSWLKLYSVVQSFTNTFLVLKGLGYKFFVVNFQLFIDIGFSHFIIFFLNRKELFFKLSKNSLNLISLNGNLPGIFGSRIVKFFSENVYKEKGFFYGRPRVIKKLKVGKKMKR